jgi:serine/threonine protein kinase
MSAEHIGDRPLVASLALPLAQAWRRALYAEGPAAAHDRALYALEALVKYLAAVSAAAWLARGAEGKNAREACAALVRPSLGHWLAILRACSAALPEQDLARHWLERVLAAPALKEVPGLTGREVAQVLDGLAAYRNATVGHGAGLSASAVAERAPAVLEQARHLLAATLGPQAPLLAGRIGSRLVHLMGPTATLAEDGGPAPAGASLFVRFDGRCLALSPLWIFDAEEDDVLVLNKGAGLAKVEYLSYGSPRSGSGLVVFKGPPAEAARRLLEAVTGQAALEAADVAALIEETEVRELAPRATSQRYGPYRIVRQVARGGQGILYEAIQESPPRRVALKTLSLEGAVAEEAHRRLREEAAALAQVDHPNVVPVYESGETDGVPWIAMKFVEGKSLAEVLHAFRGHGGPLTVGEWNAAAVTTSERPSEPKRRSQYECVAELGRDVARALAACHARGLIHRDVKPGNLMLDGSGRALLTDFGLARPVDERSQTFTRKLVGTLQYLAPEALLPAGRRGPDVRVDVYGLGATLYEALAFRPPFAGYAQDEGALLNAVQTKDAPPLHQVAPWVPRDLETVVMKCLEKDRDRRYPGAADLADDLERFLVGDPVKARRPGPVRLARKWLRHHPVLAGTLGGLLLVVLSLALWAWADYRHRREVAEVSQQQRRKLERELARDEQAAASQLEAGRFEDAEEALGRAVGALQEEPELEEVRSRLEARQSRLRRIIRFYKQTTQTWHRSGEESYDAALASCQDALNQLGVLEHHDWWRRLPAEDLGPEQRRQLEQEAYRQLLLLAGLWTRPALLRPRDPAALKGCRDALEILPRIKDWEAAQGWKEVSRTCQYVEYVDRSALGEKVRKPDVPLDPDRPVALDHPVDYFFFGLINYYTGKFKQSTLGQLFSSGQLGLAERLLRTAINLEPENYWPHFVLGRTLLARGDPSGAELAFGCCVSLRPDYSRGYEQRSLALGEQWKREKDSRLRQDLRARAMKDSARSLQTARDDPSTFWPRAQLLALFGQSPEALDAYARGLELEENLLEKLSRGHYVVEADDYAQKQARQNRDRPGAEARAVLADAYALTALVQLTRGNTAKAHEAADRALALRPDHPHALTARGFGRLHQKQEPAESLADFHKALEVQPDNYRAVLGQALACELLGRDEEALRAYDRLVGPAPDGAVLPAVPEWLRLQAQRGRYGLLTRLGRPEEARAALAAVANVNPKAARELEGATPVP